MADDIEDDVDYGSEITEQDYADARARYAANPNSEPELFGRAVTGNGVTGDTLYGSEDIDDDTPDDVPAGDPIDGAAPNSTS